MSNQRVIPLSVPNISGNEWKYVKECLDTGWISSVGSYVNKFEEMLSNYVGTEHGVATVNGTGSLHICLKLLGVQPGDYVIIPNITFVGTANAVRYNGAEPILIDADPDMWQIDLDILEAFLNNETAVNDKGECILKKDRRVIRAIMPVHLQGNMCDMDRLVSILAPYNLPMIEDGAESLGSTYKGKSAGSFGVLTGVSFNGNKIISTGGGGAIVTNDEKLAKKAKHITTTAKSDPLYYFHDEVGYNYRLVNVLAAIGVAQLEQLPKFVDRKQEISEFYRTHLAGVGDIGFQKILPEVRSNHWLFTVQTKHQKKLLTHLNANKIICRPFWMPMTKLPMYENCQYISNVDNCTTIHDTCLAIPCSTGITEEEMSIVVKEVKKVING